VGEGHTMKVVGWQTNRGETGLANERGGQSSINRPSVANGHRNLLGGDSYCSCSGDLD
jgi:hypothetical protein